MKFKTTQMFFLLFVFLIIGEKSYADGRFNLPDLQWNGDSSQVNFHAIDSYTLVSDNEEYAIFLDPRESPYIGKSRILATKVSMGSRNGFSPYKQQIYAFVPIHLTVSQSKTVYATMNSSHQLILNSSDGATDYINGIYPLTRVKRESRLTLVNESLLNTEIDSDEEIFINNGSKITFTSNQNKHTLLFEDMGWNTFKPEAQDLMPQRKIKVWLETESLTDPSERYKRLYAVIEYSHTEFAIDANGTYIIDLPIEIRIDSKNELQLTVDADVTYPFGSAFLD